MDILITPIPKTKILYFPYTGDYHQSSHIWEKVEAFVREHPFHHEACGHKYCVLSKNNPLITPPEKCHYELGVVIPEDLHVPLLMHTRHVGGHDYAITPTQKPENFFKELYHYVCDKWAPNKGRSVDTDKHCIGRYLCMSKYMTPDHFFSDVMFPLA